MLPKDPGRVWRNLSASLKPCLLIFASVMWSGGFRILTILLKLFKDTETMVLEMLTKSVLSSGGQMSAPPANGDTVIVFLSRIGTLSLYAPSMNNGENHIKTFSVFAPHPKF